MKYRGPILILFAMTLILAPILFNMVETRQDEAARLRTVGASQQACDQRSFQTSTYRIGCNHNAAAADHRRMAGSGALFVLARN